MLFPIKKKSNATILHFVDSSFLSNSFTRVSLDRISRWSPWPKRKQIKTVVEEPCAPRAARKAYRQVETRIKSHIKSVISSFKSEGRYKPVGSRREEPGTRWNESERARMGRRWDESWNGAPKSSFFPSSMVEETGGKDGS